MEYISLLTMGLKGWKRTPKEKLHLQHKILAYCNNF